MTSSALLADVRRPVIGMIHLPPLPGASNYRGQAISAIAARAVEEVQMLEAAGLDAVMLQNTHDRPSRVEVPRLTLAAMTAVACSVRQAARHPIGINLHKNDAEGALAVAAACDAAFVRIKVLVGAVMGPEGVIQGAAEVTTRVRRELSGDIEVWADLNELTSWPVTPIPIADLADLAERFGQADRLIVTRPTIEESLQDIAAARSGTHLPILVGGRTTAETIGAALAGSDGVVVGSYLRRHGKTGEKLDGQAIDRFVQALAESRHGVKGDAQTHDDQQHDHQAKQLEPHRRVRPG